MTHVVLLGDSIFDNAIYVPREPPVITQLQAALPQNSKASLLAVDGHVIEHVVQQLTRLPVDSTHLVVSVGGNDALFCSSVFQQRVEFVSDALEQMHILRSEFQKKYRLMLYHVLERRLPTAVCTIYDQIPGLGKAEQVALATFNEIILREAFAVKVPVFDLRLIFNEVSDFSTLSPIEPSSRGGEKVARAIATYIAKDAPASPYSTVMG